MYKELANQKLSKKPLAQITFTPNNSCLTLTGDWLWSTIAEDKLKKQIAQIIYLSPANITIDTTAITQIDTTGVYFLRQLIDELQHKQIKLLELKLSPIAKQLVTTVTEKVASQNITLSPMVQESLISALGRRIVELVNSAINFIGFLGHFCLSSLRAILSPTSFNYAEMSRNIFITGIQGLWVSALLSFLIGTTLAYQMSPQFETYGANVYIVNFLGIALLKEVSPLLTAVIVAGRTGSAITAEIGTQKIQEEIDALQTMGIAPMQRLVIPKVFGVMIAVPLITALSDIASMVGGAVVANSTLNVTYTMFLQRTQSDVSINNYSCGIIKSFFFAYLVALVGCFCGFNVTNNANSLGAQTTRSVVMSIMLIVLVDAIFAMIFRVLGV